jgi:uncharacterized Zn finger protein
MIKCDVCGDERATLEWKREHLPIRLSDDAEVTATPTVPVISCEACGEAYTDERAEEIREDAVKTIHVAYQAGLAHGR